MSNPYYQFRGERGASTGSTPASGAVAAAASQKEALYTQLSLSGLNGLPQHPHQQQPQQQHQQQQQVDSLARSNLLAQQQAWASTQSSNGGPTSIPQNGSSVTQASRPGNGGPFSFTGKKSISALGSNGPDLTMGAGSQNRPGSEAYSIMGKAVNPAGYGIRNKSAVFDPSEFPSLGGGGGAGAGTGAAGAGVLDGNSAFGSIGVPSAKGMNGFAPFNDMYSVGSAYGSGRLKAVEALTNQNGPGFSMQKEDFPALGGGLGGELGRSLAAGFGTPMQNDSSDLLSNGPSNGQERTEHNQSQSTDTLSAQKFVLQGDQSRLTGFQPQQQKRSQFGSLDSQVLKSGSLYTNSSVPSNIASSLASETPPQGKPYTDASALNAFERLMTSSENNTNLSPGTAVARSVYQPSETIQSPGRIGSIDSRQTSLSPSSVSPGSHIHRNMACKSAPAVQQKQYAAQQNEGKGINFSAGTALRSESSGRTQIGKVGIIGSSPRKTGADALPEDEYGVKGLLAEIDPRNGPDNVLLTQGLDLTLLGLDLNTASTLHQHFDTPWIGSRDGDVVSGGMKGAKKARTQQLDRRLPSCYFMEPPTLRMAHFVKFSLQTLFYIFYKSPRDALQVYIALELYRRRWVYHKSLKLWFAKEPALSDGDSGTHPFTFVYFDVRAWEKKPFTDATISLAQGFLSEDELRLNVFKRKPGAK